MNRIIVKNEKKKQKKIQDEFNGALIFTAAYSCYMLLSAIQTVANFEFFFFFLSQQK